MSVHGRVTVARIRRTTASTAAGSRYSSTWRISSPRAGRAAAALVRPAQLSQLADLGERGERLHRRCSSMREMAKPTWTST